MLTQRCVLSVDPFWQDWLRSMKESRDPYHTPELGQELAPIEEDSCEESISTIPPGVMDKGRSEERVYSSPSSPISSSSVSSALLPICVEEPPSYIVGVQQATCGHCHFHPYDSGWLGWCNAPVTGLLNKCCNGDLSRGLSMWDSLLPEDGSYDWWWINKWAPSEGEHPRIGFIGGDIDTPDPLESSGGAVRVINSTQCACDVRPWCVCGGGLWIKANSS